MAYTYTTLTTNGKASIIAQRIAGFEREHFAQELNAATLRAQLTAGIITQADHDTRLAAITEAITVLESALTEMTTQQTALEAL